MDEGLRPPEKWVRLRFHWLTTGHGHYCVFQWRQEHWLMPDSTYAYIPEELARHGWAYHGPCDPKAITPDETDAVQVERVARALWTQDNPPEDSFSQAAPNDWSRWPEDGRSASVAQVDHSREDYRTQARAAIVALRNQGKA